MRNLKVLQRRSIMIPSGKSSDGGSVGEESSARDGRTVTFHERLMTEVIEIPALSDELRASLYYNKKDYNEFYNDQRRQAREEMHAMVRDFLAKKMQQARTNGASQEELEAMIPRTPDHLYKMFEPRKEEDATSTTYPSDSDTDDEEDIEDVPTQGFEDCCYNWGDDVKEEQVLTIRRDESIKEEQVLSIRRGSIDSEDTLEEDFDDVAYDWEETEQKEVPAVRRRPIDDDLSDDALYALFGLSNDTAEEAAPSEPKQQNKEAASSNKSSELSDDDIYALFGLQTEKGSPLRSPSKRGYRRSINLYSPAPRGQRKGRISQLPKMPRLGGKRCERFGVLLSRSKSSSAMVSA